MDIKNILKNNKVTDLLKYSSIKYIALIIGFVKGVVNARALGPELLGVLGNLLLILSYIAYSNLGILYSMNREYVIYEANNDTEGTKKVINTSFSALIVLSSVLFIVGICMIFVYKGDLGKYIFLCFVIGILEQFRSYYINYFRLVDKIRKINYIELINNILSFILIIITIKYFRIYSVLVSMFIADCIIFIYGYKSSERGKFALDLDVLRSLIFIGFPLLIYNLGFYILTTVDRMMTIKFLTYNDLGYFTFANQIVAGTLVFITSVLFLYYPKAIKNLNVNNSNKEEVLRRTDTYTKYLEVFGVILCVFGAILIKPFVSIVVPQYEMSINIYRILLFGTIANQIAYFSNVFIVSNRKQIYLVYLQIISVILAIIFNYTFIKIGMGIIGVSLATLIVNTIYSIIQHIIYLKELNLRKGYLSYIYKVYFKFVIYMAISISISEMSFNWWLYSVIILFITIISYFNDIKATIKAIASM